MEEYLIKKISNLNDALLNFRKSMDLNLENYDDIAQDSIKSGRIQKFEFTIELLWKTIKLFLNIKNGLNPSGPKLVIKIYYESGYCTNEEYEMLFHIVEDRNLLSHIYKEEYIVDIEKKFPEYLFLMEKVYKVLEENLNK